MSGFLSKSDLVNPAQKDWVKDETATVADLMNPALTCVYEEDPALHAVQKMFTTSVHHVAVLNEESTLVGIISTVDVSRAVLAGADFSLGPNALAT